MKNEVLTGVIAAIVLPGLIACSSGSARTTAALETVWNPCIEVSDEVLRASGLVPATKDSGIAQHRQSGREVCRWDGPEYAYSVMVFSTIETVEEFERQPVNVDFRDVTIAGRAGRQFKVAGATKHLGCDVLFAAEQGAFHLRVFIDPAVADHEEPCRRLRLVGQAMVPVLPR